MAKRWQHEVAFNHLLEDGLEKRTFAEVKADCVRVLRESKLFPYTLTNRLKVARTIDTFDQRLREVYDYADAHRIWMYAKPKKEARHGKR